MKIVAQLCYIALTLVYLFVGEGRVWGGVNHINHYAIIIFLSWICIDRKRLSYFERLLSYYIIFLNASLILYTLPCIWAYRDWVIYNTNLFAIVMGMVFISTIVYGYSKYRYELGEH